jgi:hypothetical protein
MTQKIFFSNTFDMGIKNAEFDAEFESVERENRFRGLSTFEQSTEKSRKNT